MLGSFLSTTQPIQKSARSNHRDISIAPRSKKVAVAGNDARCAADLSRLDEFLILQVITSYSQSSSR